MSRDSEKNPACFSRLLRGWLRFFWVLIRTQDGLGFFAVVGVIWCCPIGGSRLLAQVILQGCRSPPFSLAYWICSEWMHKSQDLSSPKHVVHYPKRYRLPLHKAALPVVSNLATGTAKDPNLYRISRCSSGERHPDIVERCKCHYAPTKLRLLPEVFRRWKAMS